MYITLSNTKGTTSAETVEKWRRLKLFSLIFCVFCSTRFLRSLCVPSSLFIYIWICIFVATIPFFVLYSSLAICFVLVIAWKCQSIVLLTLTMQYSGGCIVQVATTAHLSLATITTIVQLLGSLLSTSGLFSLNSRKTESLVSLLWLIFCFCAFYLFACVNVLSAYFLFMV